MKYYIAHVEEIDVKKDKVINRETKGLFKTYREACQWLLDEDLEVWCEKCQFTYEYELHFSLSGNWYGDTEHYEGWIEEMEVIE